MTWHSICLPHHLEKSCTVLAVSVPWYGMSAPGMLGSNPRGVLAAVEYLDTPESSDAGESLP